MTTKGFKVSILILEQLNHYNTLLYNEENIKRGINKRIIKLSSFSHFSDYPKKKVFNITYNLHSDAYGLVF